MYLLEKHADKASAKKLYPADVQTRAKIHMVRLSIGAFEIYQ